MNAKLLTPIVLASFVGSTQAVTLISTSSITGHHRGDSDTGNGSIITATNTSGITQTGGATSPATWTHNNSWTTDWQGAQISGGTNSKIGWAVIDFGSAQTQLGEMLLWNVNEGSHKARGMNSFNIYYATSPTTAAPGVSATATDYDFSAGGWTQLGSSNTLAVSDESTTSALDGTFDISAIASAQYIGLEILTSHGAGDKVGFAEVVFTQEVVPEPSSTALLGLGGLALILRRRK